MKTYFIFFLCLSISVVGFSQDIIDIPHEQPKDILWKGSEKAYFSEIWQNPVVTNVSTPTMQIFKPDASVANGTSVIIAPGGGLYALSIDSEGDAVAKWLNTKGITAFVLKYRLVPTGADGVKEITDLSQSDPLEIGRQVTPVMPYSIADGHAAISYVRSHAKELDVNPDKIGFMGFSAGGAVTMGVTYSYTKENKPNFIVPVYPWTTVMPIQEVPYDAPPMLVVCATDDPLGLASGSIALYNSWLKDGKSVGLHMYAKGGHGFGMKTQGLPSDSWIARFYDWSVAEGITEPKEAK